MKFFAQLDSENIVQQVLTLDEKGSLDWLSERFGGDWIETSDSIRKNKAGKGMTYDSELDAFIPPKPFDSWVLDEETAQWKAPVEYPTDGKDYSWDEETTSWIEIPQDGE